MVFRIPNITHRKEAVTQTDIIRNVLIVLEIRQMAILPDRILQKEIIAQEIEHMAIRHGIYKNYMKKKETGSIAVIREEKSKITRRNIILPVNFRLLYYSW